MPLEPELPDVPLDPLVPLEPEEPLVPEDPEVPALPPIPPLPPPVITCLFIILFSITNEYKPAVEVVFGNSVKTILLLPL